MEWILLIIVILLIWALISRGNKNNPEKLIVTYEDGAEYRYKLHLRDLLETNKKLLQDIKEDKGKPRSYLFDPPTKTLKENQKYLERIQKYKTNHARLIERTKHLPAADRLRFSRDWYDYMELLDNLRYDYLSYMNSGVESFGAEENEYFQTSKENNIKVEEIERRIAVDLKNYLP